MKFQTDKRDPFLLFLFPIGNLQAWMEEKIWEKFKTSYGFSDHSCRLTDDQKDKSDWLKYVFPHYETVQVSLR